MTGTNSAAPREVASFPNNSGQAVRIPRGFEPPGEQVPIRKEHGRLVMEPADRPGLTALLDDW